MSNAIGDLVEENYKLKEEIDNLNNLGKQLVEENDKLKSQLQQKENIIKEVREYITKQVHRNQQFYEMDIENILEILDKEVNK